MVQTTEARNPLVSSESPWQTRDGVIRRCVTAVSGSAAAIANLIFPPTCQLCWRDIDGHGEVHVCAACRAELRNRKPVCSHCAMPLPKFASSVAESCPACRNERFCFASVQAMGLYDGLLRDGVLRMKKGHEEALTLTMGRLLAETVRFSDPVRPDLVVPVPMHWTRRITRGTNPPEVLAEMVGNRMRLPVALDLLRCRRKTRKQGMLLPDQRRRNVREAFSVSAGYDIRDACVLLIDDVMTTGATGNELSRVLRRAGAKQVSVAVVARGTG